MKREYTATAYILQQQQTLLLFHKKFNKWLPPGGHVEQDETPPQAAKREVKEETGLEIEFILQENVWIDYPHATSIERPYFCLLENIAAHQEKAAHQHIDFIFLAKPLSSPLSLPANCEWFDLKKALKLPPQEIFQDTLDVLKKILGD